MTSDLPITEQLTQAGRDIEQASFAIIDQEAGPHGYSAEQWPLVRRLIHASADFEFNGLTQFHPRAIRAGIEVLRAGRPIIVDVDMIRVGVSQPRLDHFGVEIHHFIKDEDVIHLARAEGSTRAVQAMRKARRLGLLDGALVSIGNAPTALLEVLRQIRAEGAQPGLIIGMPVGFVSAAESKEELAQLQDIPWILTQGRKGGSTLVVAAIHALLALAEAREPKRGQAG